jgi:membrane protein implicated in regulation of membrane protease activity
MLTVMYLVLAALGVGYVVIASILGHVAEAFDGHGGGHGDGGDGNGHAATTFHFPFFSPVALATLFGSLGGWGLILKHGFRVADETSLIAAIPLAVATGYAVTYAAWRMVNSSRGTISYRMSDLVGASAEVLTPIPPGGVGEVAAVVSGQRYSGPAREHRGREVSRGAVVKVVEVIGGTLLVTADGTGGNA